MIRRLIPLALLAGALAFPALHAGRAAETVPPKELARQAFDNPAAFLAKYGDGVQVAAQVHSVDVVTANDGSRFGAVTLGRPAYGAVVSNFSPYNGRPFEIICVMPLDSAATLERRQEIQVNAFPIDIEETSEYNELARQFLHGRRLIAECWLPMPGGGVKPDDYAG